MKFLRSLGVTFGVLTTFLFTILPDQAYASLTGNFSGRGQAVSHPQEKVRGCTQIFLQIIQNANEFRMKQGGYICQDLQASYPDFSLQTQNGKLISEGTQVGTYSENQIDLYKKDKKEGYTFHLELILNGPKMSYLEEWTDNGKPALTVKGILQGH